LKSKLEELINIKDLYNQKAEEADHLNIKANNMEAEMSTIMTNCRPEKKDEQS